MTTAPHRQPVPGGADDERRLSALIDTLIANVVAEEAVPSATAAAVRYVLAIQATDARGDACRFPRCPCLIMDCSYRLPDKPPLS